MPNDSLQTKKDGMQPLLKSIDSGMYQIPDFQRSYVWKRKDVIKLLDSIFHMYPAGSLLILENDPASENHIDIGYKGFKGIEGEVQEKTCKYLVLDGQQRLTSCYHAFYDKSKSYRYFINLRALYNQWKEHKEDYDSIEFSSCIVTKSERTKTDSLLGDLLPFSLIKTQKSFSTQRVAYADILKSRKEDTDYITFIEIELDDLLKPFLDYEFSTVELSGNITMPAVCRIFETLNNTGMKLDSFDICVAKFMRDGINLKKYLDDSKKRYSTLDILFNNDKNREMILQTIALSKNAKSHLKNKLVETINKDMIISYWDESAKYIDETMRILDDAGVGTTESIKFLPYPAMIPVIAAALEKVNYNEMSPVAQGKISNNIHTYFYTCCLTQRYTQGAASTMKEDYDLLTEWFKDDKIPEFISEGVTWVDSIMSRTSNRINAISSAIYCIMCTNGPKDLYTKKEVKAFDKNVDLHHLFPAKYYGNKFEVNRAFNMGFLTKKSNESILSQSTKHYSEIIINDILNGDEAAYKELMDSQLIDSECYSSFMQEDYDNFIQRRMNLIVSKLEKYGVKINKMTSDQLSEDKITEMNDEVSSEETI